MKIVDMICSAGRTGFFFDDQKAIKNGAASDGSAYVGQPMTPGFSQVRQAGESISVMLVLEDGQIALGDCAAVQYSGAGGRDPLFLAADFLPVLEKEIKPLLLGRGLSTFKELAVMIDQHKTAAGEKMHTAIRYGVSQALLDAVAKARHRQMADVLAEEYGLTICERPVPVFCQSGDDRYLNADKIILKGADVLPHALFNNLEKLGPKGEKLKEYLKWLVARIGALKPRPDYKPTIHIDVYGTLSLAFNNDLENIAVYLAELEALAKPFDLRIEGPVDMGERQKQIEALSAIRNLLDDRGVKVEIVADEWCNTLEDVRDFTDNKSGHMIQIKTPDLGSLHNSVEAVLYCKANNMKAYIGGTCNETDVSCKACVHVVMATGPDQCLAKPGMGVDEGFMLVYNEMNRILALAKAVR
ncbi:methylaspartate ammonia-lyase [Deltaproteobacteria bacterium OttesenSCG-928-K17]|nr:methylaspartate ammonia-lyase [Deltaproteobacteria bacterium OttesenSCG-928-K17]